MRRHQSLRVLYLFFLLNGFSLASWLSRTPAIRDGLSASTELMGIILFCFSSGCMVGILSAGKLLNLKGVKACALTGMFLLTMGLTLLASGLGTVNAYLSAAGLFIFGIGIGWAEVAINISCAAMEREFNRSLMTLLHGFFSLGTFLGALAGMLITTSDISPLIHLLAVSGMLLVLTLLTMRNFPASDTEQQSDRKDSFLRQVINELMDGSLLVIGLVVLAMALAEGSANDWLPLLMIDDHGFKETQGLLIYTGFTLCMVLGRFGGTPLVNKLGKMFVLKCSAVAALIGLLTIIFLPYQVLVVFAVLLWGLGASLGFPLALSAAGDTGTNSHLRVTIASIMGYFSFLVGPPLLGFIGGHFTLRFAMFPVAVLMLVAFIVMFISREKTYPHTS